MAAKTQCRDQVVYGNHQRNPQRTRGSKQIGMAAIQKVQEPVADLGQQTASIEDDGRIAHRFAQARREPPKPSQRRRQLQLFNGAGGAGVAFQCGANHRPITHHAAVYPIGGTRAD